MTSPLAGAWELISDTHEGRFTATDKHATWVLLRKDREPFEDPNNHSESEEIALYQSMEAATGTLSISDSQCSLTVDYSKVPNNTGNIYTFEFNIDGDILTEHYTTGETMVFRKIS